MEGVSSKNPLGGNASFSLRTNAPGSRLKDASRSANQLREGLKLGFHDGDTESAEKALLELCAPNVSVV